MNGDGLRKREGWALTAGDDGDEEERAGKVAPEGDEPVEEHFWEAESSVHDCYCSVLLSSSVLGC